MQISTKFTIAVHLLTAVAYFSESQKVTSDFLAGSIGSNPVIIRNIMGQLKEAGLIDIKRGPGGVTLEEKLTDISFLDIYKAVETNSEEVLFRFHENPNPLCPIGRTIHKSLDGALEEIQKNFEVELSKWTLADVYENSLEELRKEKKNE